jgi:hypothetical protein
MLVAMLGGLAVSVVGAQQGGAPAKRPPVQSPKSTPDPKKGVEEPSGIITPFHWPGDLPHEGLLDLEHGPPGGFNLDESLMRPILLDWPGGDFSGPKLWHLEDMQSQIATMDHD